MGGPSELLFDVTALAYRVHAHESGKEIAAGYMRGGRGPIIELGRLLYFCDYVYSFKYSSLNKIFQRPLLIFRRSPQDFQVFVDIPKR